MHSHPKKDVAHSILHLVTIEVEGNMNKGNKVKLERLRRTKNIAYKITY